MCWPRFFAAPTTLVELLIRLPLGGLFIWTGLAKLQAPYEFLAAVYSYELVGSLPGLWTATILPWLEVVVGVSLMLGVFSSGAWLLSVTMFATFTFVKIWAAARSLPIPCGCASRRVEIVSFSDALGTALLLVAGILGLTLCLAAERGKSAVGHGNTHVASVNLDHDPSRGSFV